MTADELHAAMKLADGLNLPVSIETPEELTRLCRSEDHQGYLAKMPPFPYDDPEELLGRRRDRAFYLVLDAVQDPFNFGAIIRSTDALGVDAIFVAAAQQADVTSLVVRSSAGAVNYTPLARVTDLVEWLGRLKESGLSVVGSSPRAKRDVSQCDLCRSVALVLGNEAVGIRPEILSICDERFDSAAGACRFAQRRRFGRHPLLRGRPAAKRKSLRQQSCARGGTRKIACELKRKRGFRVGRQPEKSAQHSGDFLRPSPGRG